MSKEDKIPTLNITIEERVVESKIVYAPWIVIETPYMIFSDKNGTRKIWTKNKKKIVLYYLHKIKGTKWFIKKYNEQPR